MWAFCDTRSYSHIEKAEYSRSSQTLKIVGVAVSSHIILFRFLPIFGHCNWGKKFVLIISKGKILEPIKENSYIVNYWWTSVSNSIALFWWSRRFIYFFLFVLLQFMQSQPASITWTVTSTAAFYDCWSFTEHSDLWIVLFI